MDVTALLRRRWRTVRQVWAQWRGLLLSLAALLLLTAALNSAYQRYLSWNQQRRLATAQATVEDVAKQLGLHLQKIWSFTPHLGEAPEAINLLAASQAEGIAAWEASISERYPQVRLARLLPLGTRRVDYSSSPPLSYAALDMVPQSDSNAPAPTPALLLGGTDQHIAIVQPIVNEKGTRLGHLFLALDVSLLHNHLADFAFPAGYWELQQPVGEGGIRILQAVGNQTVRNVEPLAQAHIPATGWFIAFWDRASTANETALTPRIYLWGTAAGIALLLVAYFVIRNRRDADSHRGQSHRDYPPPEAKLKTVVATALDGPLASSVASATGSASDVVELEGPETTMATAGIKVDELEPKAGSSAAKLPSVIFRAYDIRGRVGETLTPEIVMALGRAIGSEARAQEQKPQAIVVGHDARLSSPSLSEALIVGLLATGCDVVNVGRVPTPVVYFATHYLQTGNGVVITGSHNPPEYNGLKIMLGGQVLSGDQIMALRHRIEVDDLSEGAGSVQIMDIVDEYVRAIADDVPVALGNAFQIVVDCGNSVAGDIAPKLYRALGHDVIELYCEVDGHFPHHHPDPSQPENLKKLIETVLETGADLGLAFDGDGDRLGVVDGKGTILWPDRQMMLFVKDILSHQPGATVVYDVKCSDHLRQVIEQAGGQPLMWKSGHSYIRKKMQESGAPLAGELTGHIFFGDRWYGFDDAFYAGARLLELLIGSNEPPHKVFSKLPGGYSTPELRIDLAGHEHTELMARVMSADLFADAEVDRLDGLRVTYSDGWGLVRASNTTPSLVLRFEAESKDALERIQGLFKKSLLKLEPNLAIPF